MCKSIQYIYIFSCDNTVFGGNGRATKSKHGVPTTSVKVDNSFCDSDRIIVVARQNLNC